MSTSEANFHKFRRAFVLMPAGLLVAPANTNLSHQDMFDKMGLSFAQTLHYLSDTPRGYYMSGDLCLYQGALLDRKTWELKQANYKLVQQYIPDLRALFNLTDDSNMYLGVRVGRIGSVWERINKTTVGEFMRMR
ncbi:MAG: hypothetical protein ACLRFM_03165 [Alphaproteobacteria bacterium]